MRILFMFDGLGCGGRERRFVQLIKGLNKNEYNDLYLINTRNIIEYEDILSYNIHIEFIDRHKNGFYHSFIKRVNEIKPDIVQPWTDVNALHLDIAYFFLFNNSNNCLPVLKCGMLRSSTLTCSPVRGFLAKRGARLRTENAPNPLNSTLSPLANELMILFKTTSTIFSTSFIKR